MLVSELHRALNSQPTYLFFTITSRCNAFCDFCWNWKNVSDAGKLYKTGQPIKRNELTLDEIQKLTLNLSEMLVVNLFGGEPFVREDIFEIIKCFAVNCKTKYISIPSNGWFTDRILSVIEQACVEFPNTFFKMYLSLDGPSLEHNKIRKLKNGYENLIKTLDGLVTIRNKYTNLSISCNINYNFQTQTYMYSFVQEVMSWKKFDSISVDLVRGDIFDPQLLNTDVMQYKKIQNLVNNYQLNSNQPFSPLHKAIEQKTAVVIKKSIENPDKRQFNCFAGKKIILLTDIGDVVACEMMLDKKMGNIRDFNYSIPALLKNIVAKKIRQDIVDKKCNCRWDCAINTSNIFDVINYPDLILKTIKNYLASSNTNLKKLE